MDRSWAVRDLESSKVTITRGTGSTVGAATDVTRFFTTRGSLLRTKVVPSPAHRVIEYEKNQEKVRKVDVEDKIRDVVGSSDK